MKNGLIEISEAGVIIGPDFSEQAFLESPLSASSESLVHNGEHRSYGLGRHLIAGALFAVCIFFESDKLKRVLLAPIDESAKSYLDITEAVLERHTQENREWIKREFGQYPPIGFEWGSVDAELDRKGWGSSIIFSYEAR